MHVKKTNSAANCLANHLLSHRVQHSRYSACVFYNCLNISFAARSTLALVLRLKFGASSRSNFRMVDATWQASQMIKLTESVHEIKLVVAGS